MLLRTYIATPLLNLVFPPTCVGCGRVGDVLCSTCLASLDPGVIAAETPRPPLAGLAGLGIFSGPLQEAVHALKYEGLTDLAGPLGDRLAAEILAQGWPHSLIAAVPLHANRLARRGYNQAALLGAAIAARLGWPFAPDLLARTRDTRSQVGLNYSERQSNVKEAFILDEGAEIRGTDIVLIDDVYTTGATLGACAQALLAGGAWSVRAAVAGRAPFAADNGDSAPA
jgi:ComF family protein